MNIKPVTFNDPESWVKAVYDALDEVDNWASPVKVHHTFADVQASVDKNHDEVMTAMAWICESLNIDPLEVA